MSLEVALEKKLKGFSLDLAFQVHSGCLGILGASGCGKSMTLKSIAGIVRPDRGRIVLHDRVLLDTDKRIDLPPQKRKVGYLFQNYALFPNMTVEENVGIGLRLSRQEKEPVVRQMISHFRLDGLEQRYPWQLSGGQQQRVALARILAYHPDVLLLDEPFSALDAYLKEELQMELARLLREYDGLAILVTHNRDEVYKLCGNLMTIHQGRMLSFGDTRETFHNPVHPQVARLTGCKNLSRAQAVGENQVRALDWAVTLQTAQPIPPELTHIGIRAHDFYPVGEQENVINPIPLLTPEVSEAPFEWNVIFKADPSLGDGGQIWWKLTKDIWSAYLQHPPTRLAVKPEHILLLSEKAGNPPV